MTVHHSLEIQHPAARTLADLAGIRADLDWIQEAMDAYVDPSNDRSVVREGLWAASVIRYGRCFGEAVRFGIPAAWIEALPDDLQRYHRDVRDLRNKHVAHSVNPYEHNSATVLVPESIPDDWQPRVSGHGHETHGMIPSDREARLLARLAAAVKARVEQEMNAERDRLTAVLRGLDVSEIRSWRAAGAKIPKRGDVRKRRTTTGAP